MSIKTVYLAGPIAGLTEGDAKGWRHKVIDDIWARSKTARQIKGISPLRCEPAIDGRYDVPDSEQEQDPRFGTALAIASKNEFDTRNCDMVLAYLPKSDRMSVGTIMEIAWAKMLNKPVVFVSDDEYLRSHPLIVTSVSWILDDLDQAVDVIVGVMEDYV